MEEAGSKTCLGRNRFLFTGAQWASLVIDYDLLNRILESVDDAEQ